MTTECFPVKNLTQKYCCYYRVSTPRQNLSGLGLDAQRNAVAHYVAANPGEILDTFTETESGKQVKNRPQLLAALDLCRRQRAVLLIAKLDRLARNVHFVSGLLESGVSFIAADQPSKDRFMLHVQAAFAEEEARRISVRTREALAAAKRRGVDVGATGRLLAEKHRKEAFKKAEGFRTHFLALRQAGCRTTASFRDGLNALGVPGPGAGRWHLPNTHRTLRRLGMALK